MTDRQRAFLAIWPPVSVVDAVARLRSTASGAPDIRWTAPDRLHITLLFLGDQTAEQLESIETDAAAIIGGTPAGDLTISGGGRFGAVLWAGVAGEWLSPLHRRLRRSLSIPREHSRFRPHLTVARQRGRGSTSRALTSIRALPGVTWRPTEATLVTSQLGPDPRYLVVAHLPFATA